MIAHAGHSCTPASHATGSHPRTGPSVEAPRPRCQRERQVRWRNRCPHRRRGAGAHGSRPQSLPPQRELVDGAAGTSLCPATGCLNPGTTQVAHPGRRCRSRRRWCRLPEAPPLHRAPARGDTPSAALYFAIHSGAPQRRAGLRVRRVHVAVEDVSWVGRPASARSSPLHVLHPRRRLGERHRAEAGVVRLAVEDVQQPPQPKGATVCRKCSACIDGVGGVGEVDARQQPCRLQAWGSPARRPLSTKSRQIQVFRDERRRPP